MDGDSQVSIQRIALKPRRDLRILEGTLQELGDAGMTDPGREDYIMARLTDTGAWLDAMSKLRTACPNALVIERVQSSGSAVGLDAGQDHRKIGMLELFRGFFSRHDGATPRR